MSSKEEKNYNPLEYFSNREILSLKRIVDDSVKTLMMNMSYISFSQIRNQALKTAEKDIAFASSGNRSVADALEILVEEKVEKEMLNLANDKQNPTSGVFTTKDMLVAERNCLDLAKSKNANFNIPSDVVEKHLKQMPLISSEQRDAVYHVCYSEQMVSIYQGLAGAGKSFTSAAIKESFIEMGYAIKGLALSWNAAFVLSASAKIDDCQAIEAFCRNFAKSKKSGGTMFEKDTLLLVDEAGLVGTNHMNQILLSAKEAKDKYNLNIKVVLTGDALQLLPVNAGGMFKTLEREIGSSTIKTIRRQNQSSQRRMVELSSQRRSGNALYTMMQQENLHWNKNHETTVNHLIRDYLSHKIANPNKKGLILALSNNHVFEINDKVRKACKKLGFLSGMEIETTVSDGKIKKFRARFCAGDEIVVRSNYRDTMVYEIPKDENNFDVSTYKVKKAGVFNRNNGKIVRIEECSDPIGSYNIYIDLSGDLAGRTILNTKKHLTEGALPIHHNYATTIYGSQGQTVEEVFMLFDEKIDFRLFYVGISRHKENIGLYLNETLLHTLCDKNMGKSVKKTKDNEEQNVVLGRYSRMEMLNVVSVLCGKNKENETAIDYMHKMSQPEKKEISETELYAVRPVSFDDYLMDFDDNYKIISEKDIQDNDSLNKFWQSLYIAEKSNFCSDEEKLKQFRIDAEEMNENFHKFKSSILKNSDMDENYSLEVGDRIYTKKKTSVKFPLIDLQKILDEKDEQYEEAIIIPDMETTKNRYDRGVEGFQPVYTEEEDRMMMETEIKELNLISIQDFLNKLDKVENQPEEPEEEKLNTISKINKSVFGKVINFEFKKKEKKEEELVEEETTLKQLVKKEIPFIEEQKNFLKINKKGLIEIVDEDYEKIGDEDFLEWLNECKITETNKNGYWQEGKFHEPRFLAFDSNGVIKERYDQHGNAKIGTGYPALLPNPFVNKNTPVYLTPGVMEWMWSYRFYTQKGYADLSGNYENIDDMLENITPEDEERLSKIPELIWATNAIDYGLVKEYLKGRKLTIIKGRGNKNDVWAINLRRELWNKWYIKCDVLPKFEREDGDYAPPWLNASEKELKIADGNFKSGDLIREISKLK